MLKGEKVSITDPNMTRFFWTREQSVDLIFECIEKAKDSTPWIPEMKGMRMGDLIEAMMQKYGKVEVEEIGNRGGENSHETMGQLDRNGKLIFSDMVEQYLIDDIMKLI
jgi:UDP-glucose 4-epimerase